MSAFIKKLAQQETPGRPDYPRFDVEVISPELPCGVAWLASAMIELDVPLWKPWGLRDDRLWLRLGHARYRHVCRGSPWSRVVAGFQHNREFRFRSTPVPRFSHGWPGLLAPLPAVILFVRDPRDALYSGWRRARRSGELRGGVDFESFVAAPYHHYPMSWGRWLALFLALWRHELAGRRHLVVRFEDVKADPIGMLRRTLAFLGMEVGDRALARACVVAEHANVKRIEENLVAMGVVPSPLLARGEPFEYRRHFTPRMEAALGRTSATSGRGSAMRRRRTPTVARIPSPA